MGRAHTPFLLSTSASRATVTSGSLTMTSRASRRDMIWYRATQIRQSYSRIIEDMNKRGYDVTLDEIRQVVAESKAS